jgi:hypothetical protein
MLQAHGCRISKSAVKRRREEKLARASAQRLLRWLTEVSYNEVTNVYFYTELRKMYI